MQNFKTRDVFKAFRLIKASNLREELMPLLERASEADDVRRLGIDFYLTIFDALAEKGAEDGFYDLLSGPFECNPKEIEELSVTELMDKFKELSEVADVKAFLDALSNLITSKS